MTGNQRKAITYHGHIKGHHASRQNAMVLEVMATLGQPQPIRMIHKAINGRGYVIDLVSLRRAITNLSKPDPKGRWINQWGRAVVMEAYERPCPITKKTVGWYQLVPNEKQLDLFSQQSPEVSKVKSFPTSGLPDFNLKQHSNQTQDSILNTHD